MVGSLVRSVALAMVTLLVIAGCGSGGAGTRTLHILTAFETGTAQGKVFQKILDDFRAKTGVTVVYEGNQDEDKILKPRVAAKNPPDVVVLPDPGSLKAYVNSGDVVALDGALDYGSLATQYDQSWLDLPSVNGKHYGVFVKVGTKGLMWYSPPMAAAVGLNTAPTTWDEALANARSIRATGRTPFCVAIASGSATGWPATDWIKDFVLRSVGPRVYRDWYEGRVKFSDPAIKKAFQQFGEVVGLAYGGPSTITSTDFAKDSAVTGLFDNPPKCYLEHQSPFIAGAFVAANPALKPGTDFDFYAFPDINPQFAGSEVVGGDMGTLFRDSPPARQLLQYLTSPEVQTAWVKEPTVGALSANRSVAPDAYPDLVSRKAAAILLKSKNNVFDAGDAMAPPVKTAFWKAATDYVTRPANLDAILATMDQAQADAAKG